MVTRHREQTGLRSLVFVIKRLRYKGSLVLEGLLSSAGSSLSDATISLYPITIWDYPAHLSYRLQNPVLKYEYS